MTCMMDHRSYPDQTSHRAGYLQTPVPSPEGASLATDQRYWEPAEEVDVEDAELLVLALLVQGRESACPCPRLQTIQSSRQTGMVPGKKSHAGAMGKRLSLMPPHTCSVCGGAAEGGTSAAEAQGLTGPGGQFHQT